MTDRISTAPFSGQQCCTALHAPGIGYELNHYWFDYCFLLTEPKTLTLEQA
jgi:hypothetical protein